MGSFAIGVKCKSKIGKTRQSKEREVHVYEGAEVRVKGDENWFETIDRNCSFQIAKGAIFFVATN